MPEPCCPCMSKGRCVRCSCVKGRRCVDCRPSRSLPARCENQVPSHNNDACSAASESQNAGDTPHQDEFPDSWSEYFANGQPRVNILRRIPKASRDLCARKLATVIEVLVANKSVTSWRRLMDFPRKGLRVPR